MKTELINISKKKSSKIDQELVEDFKQGLKELKSGKAIKC